MHILILLKMVPDVVEDLEIASDGKALDLDYLRMMLSESDEHALEQALLLKERHGAKVTVLALDGRIVFGEETHSLREKVKGLLAAGKKKIVLNLGDVSYIDSSGVGELVGSYTTVRNQGGELKLLNLNKKVHDLLQITKLYTIFDIKDNEFTAVKSFDWFFAK